MATYLFDLDGTIFNWGTNTPLPGAVPMLANLRNAGHKIVFTTNRPRSPWTLDGLRNIGFEDNLIIFDIPSPRIIVNDEGAHAINHPTDTPWNLKGQLT